MKGDTEREKKLEAWFRREVRLAGGYTIKLVPVEVGTPDRLVFFPTNRLFLVELKAGDGALDPAQIVWHRRIGRFGVPVATLTGRDECSAWISRVTNFDDSILG